MTAKEWKDLYINWKRLCAANPSATSVIHMSVTYKDLIGSPFGIDAKASYTIDTKGAYINNMHEFYIAFTIDLPDMLEHRAICTVIRADGLGYGEKFISNDSDLAVKYPVLEGLGKKMQEIIDKYQPKEEEDKPMEEPTKMPFVTLCGSHRFYDDFIRIKNDMEKDGNTHVFTPEIFQFADPSKLDEKTHQRLDELHQAKMRMSDYVLIVNKDGYIGNDTQKEIDWCKANNIKLNYLEPIPTRKIAVWEPEETGPRQQRIDIVDPITGTKSMSEFQKRKKEVLARSGSKFWFKEYLIDQGQRIALDKKVQSANIKVNIEIER